MSKQKANDKLKARVKELEDKLEVACDCAGCGTNDTPECQECVIIKALPPKVVEEPKTPPAPVAQ